METYEIIVIGGGHAGCEAALSTARRGARTLLVSLHKDRIAAMSCNPAIGGQGKGQLVKEVDAMGGEMGRNADLTGIHFRVLNMSKGPAVHSSRCQNDRFLYASRMQQVCDRTENLTVIEGEVSEILFKSKEITGIVLNGDIRIACRALIITAGTFMRGLLHFGLESTPGGRIGDRSARTLSDSLEKMGFALTRLKTGTPPRLDKNSLDFSKMQIQNGDNPPKLFSHWGTRAQLPQVPCHMTYTNEKTHDVIRKNFSESPLYSGKIVGRGPRYCPSIEDKVVRFSERLRHHIFVEPEGLSTDRIYPNGLSTSLPPRVQVDYLQTIEGFENCKVIQPGYAVEYDSINPTTLKATMESRDFSGLFLAGQINGTSGYEEAAAQGFVAGLNAFNFCRGLSPVIFSRNESYIGVMTDDLTKLGVDEPYRMFTARCENRLVVREDNAVHRLGKVGLDAGLLSKRQFEKFLEYELKTTFHVERFKKLALRAGSVIPDSTSNEKMSAYQWLKRPEISVGSLVRAIEDAADIPQEEIWSEMEVRVKYEGYVERQLREIERQRALQEEKIPLEMPMRGISGLSHELQEKLQGVRPKTMAEASRISGMTPAGLVALSVGIKKWFERPRTSYEQQL